MRGVHYAAQFKRDLKRIQKSGSLTLEELEHVVGMQSDRDAEFAHIAEKTLGQPTQTMDVVAQSLLLNSGRFA